MSKQGQDQNDQATLVERFLTEFPHGVIESMHIPDPRGSKHPKTTGMAVLVWQGAKQAQLGRDRAEETLANGINQTPIEEIEARSPVAVGFASMAEDPSAENQKTLMRLAVGQALSRFFAGETRLPAELLAFHDDGTEAATTVLPMASFDLRGPGSSWRTRVAQFFGNRRFIRQTGQEDRPATGGQRIFIAHLMLRAERSWDEIMSAVAALATWGDVDAAKASLTAELDAIEEVEGEGRDLPTLGQWLLIGDLITDRELSQIEAEQLWLRALTRDGAELTIRHLKEGRPFATTSAAA